MNNGSPDPSQRSFCSASLTRVIPPMLLTLLRVARGCGERADEISLRSRCEELFNFFER
jgi:hypothetical protein